MESLGALRRDVHGRLFARGYTMTRNSAGAGTSSTPASAQAQTQVDPVLLEALRAIDKMRALDGERAVNHMLRNLLQQSNKRLSDLGMPAADDNADLRVQLLKEQSEASQAKQYANHFGTVLRSIQTTAQDEWTASKAKRALEWNPGDKTEQEIEDATRGLERATH